MQTVDEKKAKLVEAFGRGMTFLEAAQAVGVGTTTVRRWCDADPAFKAAVDDARDKSDDTVEAVTFANCCDPDPAHNTLRMFWLKSRRPEVYRDTVKQIVEDARKSYETANAPENL